MRNYSTAILPILFLLSLLIGCGGNQVKIKGTVTLEDGTPVPNGTIFFQGEKFQAYGDIASDGSYFLTTQKKGDGVAPGNYKVVIAGTSHKPAGKKLTDPMDTGEEPVVNMLYSEYETTPLSCEVTKSETMDFKVKPFDGYIRKN